MIQTSTDYHAAIDFLILEADINVGDINEKMNAGEVNSIFGDIEMQLDNLYEKTRVLEDVQNYCREYMIKEITEKRQKFEAKLKMIEHNADSYQDTSFIACEVPFVDSNEIVRDRDGSIIPSADIVSGSVVASGQEIEKTLFSNVTKKQLHPCYRDNLTNLVDDKPYRVFYMFDAPVDGGVEEDITIAFNGIYKCNFLKIQTSNCDIIDIKYINESDAEETAGDIYNACGVMKSAKGLKVRVRSTNYENEKHKIDVSKSNTDFWGTICEERFRRTQNMLSLYDITQSAGEAQYCQNQDDFKLAIDLWQKEKAEVDSRNIVMMQKVGGGE